MSGVVVLGSANADLVVEISRRPSGGETLLGSDLQVGPGGKGANQAAAAARAGGAVHFLGCVGDDDHGQMLLQSLRAAGADVDRVQCGARPTGTALIFLTPDGENSIVVSPGANHEIDIDLAEKLSDVWLDADVLVLNLELPMDTVRHVIARAAAAGARVLLNAAPAQTLQAAMLAACDPIVVNEHEARIVLGVDDEATFEQLAQGLLDAGARSGVVTLGGGGALVADVEGVEHVPAHLVEVIDTTGAGDAFVGAIATELAHGVPLRNAVRFATAMAAVAVQHRGTQASYPNREGTERFLVEARSA